MGLLFSSLYQLVFGKKEVRILVLGLDNAGKTTLLHRLHKGEVIRTMPTIGFNVETITYQNLSFQIWDLGGQTNIRPYWRCYYPNTDAIIYVVDSADKARIAISHEELIKMLQEDELKSVFLLVYANKQDLPNALTVGQVSEALGLANLKDRHWHIEKSCAITGIGLKEGMDWLSSMITNQ